MAKSKSKSSIEAQGPTESGYAGYGPEGSNPANPSDAIFAGRTLPTVQPVAVTQRRDFYCVTRNPLHYNSGPGTDEVVSARRVPPDVELAEVAGQPGRPGGPGGPNDCKTSNGVEIYGT